MRYPLAIMSLLASSIACAQVWQVVDEQNLASGQWSEVVCEDGEGYQKCENVEPTCAYVPWRRSDSLYYAGLKDIEDCPSYWADGGKGDLEDGWWIGGIKVGTRHQTSIVYQGKTYTIGAYQGQSATQICQNRAGTTFRRMFYAVCAPGL